MKTAKLVGLTVPSSRLHKRFNVRQSRDYSGYCRIDGSKVSEIMVPLGNDAISRATRVHELCHAKYTVSGTTKRRNPANQAAQMAEDVRISCEYAPDIAKRDFLVSALTQIREAKKAASIEPSAELATVFIRELATLLRWGMSLQCHKAKEWIFELLESWEIARPLARTAASDPSDAKRFRACEIICKIVTAKQPIDEQPEDFTDSPSAAMKIETPARTIPCFQGMGDIVAARSGRFNVRAAIAETAFPMGRAVATRELDHEGRGFSGTILIDGSGSMGWAVDAIENLAASAPASLIAVYNGSGGRGELIIVAKNGMRSPTVEITYGGNDVDYPAIIWLLGQAGPRVLISDLNFYGGKKAEREAARYLVGSLDKVLTSADAAERWVKSIAN